MFPYAAEGLLGDAEVRRNVGEWYAVQQRWMRFHKIPVTGCRIFRYHRAFAGFQEHAGINHFTFDIIPSGYIAGKRLPVLL